MTAKRTPTADELTKRSRVMTVEIDRTALEARAKKDAEDDADDEEIDDPNADDIDDEDHEDEDDSEDERSAKAARRTAKRATKGATRTARFASDVQTAVAWLTSAIQLHQKHMDGTVPPTEGSQALMMTQMESALAQLSDDAMASEGMRAYRVMRGLPTRADRKLRIRAAAGEVELLPISISSEYPVERYDWWDDERYDEVLAHTAAAVDLSRATNGLPFLDSHDAMDGQARMGRVLNVRLDGDGKLRGDVKFSKRQVAQDLRQDFLDGIACEISVGYRIDPNNITRSQEKDGPVVKRINRWMPYEVSSVSVPADPTVGAGRSAGEAAHRALSNPLATAHDGHRSSTMTEAEKAAAAAGSARTGTWVDSPESKEEKQRVDDIITLCGAHAYSFDEARQFIASGKTVSEVKGVVLDEIRAKGARKVPTAAPAVELTPKEQRQYSMQNAIRGLVADIDGVKRGSSSPDSFEREISEELAKKMPTGNGVERRGGMLVPTFTRRETVLELQHGLPFGSLGNIGQRAGLDSGTATKGAELKFTVPGEFLALLRNYMAVMDAGATMLGGLQGPVAFPAQTAAATATWMGENPGADVSDSNALLSQIGLNPRALQASTSYSRQLLAQSVIDVDGMVRADLAAIMGLALDLAAIAGTGASNQPTGVLNTAGIGSVALGANGATPTYSNLVDLETQVAAANADQWDLSYLVHPTSRGTFKKATVLGNTIGLPAWQPATDSMLPSDQVQGRGARVPGELNGYKAFASAQVPNNLTKGTSAGICLAVLFGAFSQLVIGDWGMMEVIVDPYRLKKQGMIELTSFGMFGIAVKYAAAFSASKDALA
jgi:HK97 family phage major capsid protein